MSEKLAELKKKGGGSSEAELLWTNPNYRLNGTCPASTDLSAYDYDYLIISSSWSTNSTLQPVYDTYEVVPFTNGSYKLATYGLGTYNNAGCRNFTINNKVITWGASYTGAGSSDTSNRYNMPVNIYGVKLSIPS